MASYAAGNAGGKEGQAVLENLFKTFSGIFFKGGRQDDFLQNIVDMPDILSIALDLYNRSEYIEAKGKLENLLGVYSEANIPGTGFPPLDGLVANVAAKTRGLILCALAVCQFSLAFVDEALSLSDQAIAAGEETGDAQLRKIALSDRGYMEMVLGNYYTALTLMEQGLEIDASSHDPWRKRNRTLLNMAILYSNIGDSEKALECVERSLECAENENDVTGKAKALNAKGVLLFGEESFEEARWSLETALNLSVGELQDRHLRGLVLNNLATLHYHMSDLEGAERCLAEACEIAESTDDTLLARYAYSGKAILCMEDGDFERAGDYAVSALDACNKGQDVAGQADMHFMLGMIARCGFDDMHMAYEHFGTSIELSESIRTGIGVDDLKISFASTYAAAYQNMVALCVEMGDAGEAFRYVERSKSRALVDMLSGAVDAIPRDDASHELGIIRARLDLLRKELRKSHLTLVKGTERDLSAGKEGLMAELQDLERRYTQACEELKAKDPEWLSFVAVDTISSEGACGLVDSQSAMLNFFQMQEALIVVVINGNREPSVVTISLDAEAVFEKVISVVRSLSAGRGLDTMSHEYIREIRKPLSDLYNIVFTPLKEHLEGVRHLIISPHFFWHYLPFSALYNSEEKRYLIDDYSISITPSATTLSFCLNKDRKYSGDNTANQQGRALVLANPSRDLPYTEEEAELIGRVFNVPGKKSRIFKGNDASFDKLVEYQHSDIVHLACHGYFREDNPLFSCVVLSDEDGNECPYYVPDIFNINLNASLVTLSACETGLSQYTSGDELLGLTRAFFYAGAPSVVASLWPVNDRSTSVFMESFYKALIEMKMGRAQALSYAMKATKDIAGYEHPYYWAPFFLSGDWN